MSTQLKLIIKSKYLKTNLFQRFLDLEEYSDGFLENGYDDMETVKLIERDDLVAIGRVNLKSFYFIWYGEKSFACPIVAS